jgi:hypothetical protein
MAHKRRFGWQVSITFRMIFCIGSFEHGNEPSGSIKCLEFLEWLSDWRLLKDWASSVKLVF